MNPYVILAAVVLLGLSIGGAGWQGFRLGRDHEIAAQAKQDEVVKASREAMQQTAAEAIGRIEIKHVTLKQQLDTEIREKPVYRDCVATPDGLRYINAALTGEDEPAHNSLVPSASAADGPELRINGSEAGRSSSPVP